MLNVSRVAVSLSRKRIGIVLSVLGGVFLLGCSKPERDFTVDVFIRTKGGENIKCGLVTVQVLEENAFATRQPEILQTLSKRASELQTDLNAASKQLNFAKSEYDVASEAASEAWKKKTELWSKHIKLADSFGYVPSEPPESPTKRWDEMAKITYNKGYLQAWNEKLYSQSEMQDMQTEMAAYKKELAEYQSKLAEKKDIETKTEQTKKALDAAENQHTELEKISQDKSITMSTARREWQRQEGLVSGWYQQVAAMIFDSLPPPVVSLKTDADGRCAGKVPTPARYAIAAQFSRLVGEQD